MTIGWAEAVMCLARERTRSEVVVSLLKKYGNERQRDRGALLYGEAKADIDAVIDGLLVVLAQRDLPTALPGLEKRLHGAVERTEQLAEHVRALIPDTTGERSGVGDLLAKTVEALLAPLVDAVRSLWRARLERDAVLRATIRTQLEGTRWRDFDAIPGVQ
jgi:hypothetical protein